MLIGDIDRSNFFYWQATSASRNSNQRAEDDGVGSCIGAAVSRNALLLQAEKVPWPI
jgi:hypothetical protein